MGIRRRFTAGFKARGVLEALQVIARFRRLPQKQGSSQSRTRDLCSARQDRPVDGGTGFFRKGLKR